MSLRERAIRAGFWTIASYSVELSTRLISNLIMTRLLFPDAFGVIAAAMALIVGLQLLSDFGVRTVIIQSPRGEDTDFLRSAWVFQTLRCVVLWLLLAVGCMSLGIPQVRSLFAATSVFATPSFPATAAVLGLMLILGGLESTALPLNVRKLNFRPIVVLDLTARIVPLPIMIGWAYLFPSAWSIVVGTLAGAGIRAVMSHLVIPGPRMAFVWNADHIKEIVAFGKWINVSSWASFISLQSDIIILGLLLPGPVLGIYFIAKTLVDAVESLLERLNGSMTLPVLGEVIRSNPGNLRSRYYRFRLPIELVAAGSAGFMFSSSDFIVHLLYDQRYSEAGIMLKVLSLGLVIYPFQLIRSAFTAIGRTDLVAGVSVLQAVSLVSSLSLGYCLFGTLGAIGGVAFSRLIPSVTMIVLAQRRHWISAWNELRWIPICVTGLLLGELVSRSLHHLTVTSIRQMFW